MSAHLIPSIIYRLRYITYWSYVSVLWLPDVRWCVQCVQVSVTHRPSRRWPLSCLSSHHLLLEQWAQMMVCLNLFFFFCGEIEKSRLACTLVADAGKSAAFAEISLFTQHCFCVRQKKGWASACHTVSPKVTCQFVFFTVMLFYNLDRSRRKMCQLPNIFAFCI